MNGLPGKGVKKNIKGIRRTKRFRELSVPSLAAVAFHLVGLSLLSGDYEWFAFYLKAALNVSIAEHGEISLALDPFYAKISCLEKNLKDQAFL